MSEPVCHIVIVGATSAIAEHCARLWAAREACAFTLIGRDLQRLTRVADDLRVRGPHCSVREIATDLLDASSIELTVQTLAADGPIDRVLIAHGLLPDQQACETSVLAADEALQVNAVSPALWAQACAAVLVAQGWGTLAILGSVAGDRGRQSNFVYGAAKGLLDRLAQGLQHRLAGTAVRVVLIKPGPTDTPMTAHMKGAGMRLAPVQAVAQGCVAAIDRGQPVAYVPVRWALIMMVIRHLPRFVFNRMRI